MGESVYKSQGAWNYVVWLDQKTDAEVNEIGAKAFGLLNLAKWDLPVPNGFAITTKGYEEYTALMVEHPSQLTIKRAGGVSQETLRERSERIRELFNSNLSFYSSSLISEVLLAYRSLCEIAGVSQVPVSVRSSASHEDTFKKSYAGSYETYLNVVGEDELLEAIMKCWASLWKKHLLRDYAKEKIGAGVKMAVIVQQMICADVAGVAFTADPVTGSESELVINSSWGLGESVVSGNVTADMFAVDKRSREITRVRIGSKSRETRCANEGGTVFSAVDERRANSPSLDHHQIVELSRTCFKVADHFSYPIDLEWAMKDNTFYILQVRPITTS